MEEEEWNKRINASTNTADEAEVGVRGDSDGIRRVCGEREEDIVE